MALGDSAAQTGKDCMSSKRNSLPNCYALMMTIPKELLLPTDRTLNWY